MHTTSKIGETGSSSTSSSSISSARNIVVYGAGALGTAMAVYCHGIGHKVTLVPKFDDQAKKIAENHENIDFLPGVPVPEDIFITSSTAEAFPNQDLAIIACPSIGLATLCEELQEASQHSEKLPPLLSMCKGLQSQKEPIVSDLIERLLPQFDYGVLAGPANADLLVHGPFTTMVLATQSKALSQYSRLLSSSTLHVTNSTDVRGVELGGCLKNIYAIGAGICDGLSMGDNAKAAYMTHVLHELVTVGVAMGGQFETFYGLSGFGDLMATSTGKWSRNRSFGEELGKGKTVSDILAEKKAVVEGYKTTAAFFHICGEEGIPCPILDALHAVLYEGMPLPQFVRIALTQGEQKTL